MEKAKYLAIREKLDLERKPGRLVTHFIADVLILGCSFLLWQWNPWAAFVSIPLFAAWIFRSFGLMHDAVHGAVSSSRFLNDLVGLVTGAVCFLPYANWRKGHLEHHFWSGNFEKDPVMAFTIVFPKFSKSQQAFLNFFWNRWFPILSIVQMTVFWLLSFKTLFAEKKNFKLAVSLLMPLALWSGVLMWGPAAFVATVAVPSIVLYLLAVEVVNLPHHLQLPQYQGDVRLQIWDQHETARSCIYPRWFARSVVLNFNYHSEHHMFPEVPWYHLDRLHQVLKQELGQEYNSDPYFQWILENKPKPLAQVLASPEGKRRDSRRLAG